MTEEILKQIDNELRPKIEAKLSDMHDKLWEVISLYSDYIHEEVIENVADIIKETTGQDGRLNNRVRQMMSANTVSNIDSALSSINLRIKSIEKINNEYVIKAI